MTTSPPAGTASPQLALELTATKPLLDVLPAAAREYLGASNTVSVRWNLDHEDGVDVNGLHFARTPSTPRAPGPRAPTVDECPTDGPVPEVAKLFFVEADDDGEALDEAQLDAVFKAVEDTAANAIVAVFVHGWQHSAALGDSNVCDFAALMRAVEMMEQGAAANRKRRAVIGIYVGWPGALYPSPPANAVTTFWNRLQVADNVGNGPRALLPRLVRGLVERLPPKSGAPADRSSALVVAGHSLGARAVFHAVRQNLEMPGDAQRPDVVLLVNPAFSANLYTEVHKQRCMPGPPRLLFSSETDGITRQIYPAGQSVSYAPGELTPFAEHIYTAGNFERFVTHRLDFELLNPAFGSPAEGGQTFLRGFERVPPGSRGRELYETDDVTVYRPPPPGRAVTDADRWYRMRLERLDATPNCSATSKVVTVDRDIVADHNGIFTPPFMEYVVRVLNDSLRSAGE